MNIIGLPELLILQTMFLTNLSDLVTGNFLGPLAKTLCFLVTAGATL